MFSWAVCLISLPPKPYITSKDFAEVYLTYRMGYNLHIAQFKPLIYVDNIFFDVVQALEICNYFGCWCLKELCTHIVYVLKSYKQCRNYIWPYAIIKFINTYTRTRSNSSKQGCIHTGIIFLQSRQWRGNTTEMNGLYWTSFLKEPGDSAFCMCRLVHLPMVGKSNLESWMVFSVVDHAFVGLRKSHARIK